MKKIFIYFFAVICLNNSNAQSPYIQCPPSVNCVPNITLAGGVVGTFTTGYIPVANGNKSLTNSIATQSNNVINIPTLTSNSVTSQYIIGQSSAAGSLNLYSTSNATKGKVFFGEFSAFDEANNRFGIGTTAPTERVHMVSSTLTTFLIENSLNSNAIQKLKGGGGQEWSLVSSGSGSSVGAGRFSIQNSVGDVLILFFSKNIGIGGITTPTAQLHLSAGTTVANTAPLKFTSGSLLTTPEAGSVEFLTDKWYATITTGAARKEVTLNDAALTSGTTPVATTNGRLTDGLIMTAGTYTPTLTNVTNVAASTPYRWQYSRVGSVVTVSGALDIDATSAAGTATEVGATLPIVSDFTGFMDCGGDAISDVSIAGVTASSARVKADATNNRASITLNALSTTNDTYSIQFTYIIQ